MNLLKSHGLTVLLFMVASCLSDAAAAQDLARAQDARPNIVIILSDDQAWGDYGFMGHPQIQTPALDALAEQSLTFTRGYVPDSLCRPSLATIATGLYPHQHGIVGNDPPGGRGNLENRIAYTQLITQVPTLPRILGEHGYLSHQSGKWWEGSYQNGGFTHGMTHGDRTRGGRHGDDGLVIGRQGLAPVFDFIDMAKEQERPFFVWYAPFMPHTPHTPPAELLEKYRALTPSESVAKYWAMCEWFDQTCGQLLAHLDEQGLAENTLVVYVCDNGWIQQPNGGGYAPRSKRSQYDGGVRTPIMFRWPAGIEPMMDQTNLCSSIDIVPTILAAVGLEPTQAMQGINVMDRDAVVARDAIFGEILDHDIQSMTDPAASSRPSSASPTTPSNCSTSPTTRTKRRTSRPKTPSGSSTFASFSTSGGRRCCRLNDRRGATITMPGCGSRMMMNAKTLLSCLLLTLLVGCNSAQQADAPTPNIILIYMDDMGYGDLGCYGSTTSATPTIDRMADEGIRFTDFYSTSGVCTPSRSSLMTGCYPRRVNMHVDENDRWVLFPVARKGLNPEENTIADQLRASGYITACIGKWHLGDQPQFLPTAQGFDAYFGIPYSNDMNRNNVPLPLLRDATVIEAPVRQDPITQRYTEEALAFINRSADAGRPFFLYLPHTAVHLPLHPGQPFQGHSGNGAYCDWVEEVDASMAQIFEALQAQGIDDNTLVIFTSDNGSNARNGGSNGPLRGTKGSTDEGGQRVPCIMRWPGNIPAGTTSSEIASTMDMLPTLAAIVGSELPEDRVIDGRDIRELIFDAPNARSPHEAFYYYHTTQLQAARSGKWKLVLPQEHKLRGWDGVEENTPLQLFDLSTDIGETNNVAEDHPQVVARLMAYAQQARLELGDGETQGTGQRPAGWVDEAQPLLLAQ